MHSTDELTYKNIFRQYYAGLVFYATRLVGSGDAEDIVQSVFVNLWAKRNKIDSGDRIQAFLYKSVYSRCLNLLQHRKVKDSYFKEQLEIDLKRAEYYKTDEAISNIINSEIRQKIAFAISSLPEKCRHVFILSYIKDMKNKEIAQLLGISDKTVEAHIYKALKIVRELLKNEK